MLTIDLNKDVSATVRDAFYAELQKKQWKRIPELTTLWFATWKGGTTADAAITTTKQDVEAAAQASGVAHYDASVAVSGKPVVWKK
ncbi:MAG: hypothetical protein M5U15_05190 [Kiritimatiellae bacterium]|nr:hypothetical protein [Kiritimatiellia bacterium]